MAFKFNQPSSAPLVWPFDDSVDLERSNIKAYKADPAMVRDHIKFKSGAGAPTIFHCRPLTHEEHQQCLETAIVLDASKGALFKKWRQSREALKLALTRVENAEWRPDLEGKGGEEVVSALPHNIVSSVGALVVTMGSAVEPLHDDPFSRLEAMSADCSALVEALGDGAGLSTEAQRALNRLRERLALPPEETLDPSEEASEDLPK